MKVIIFAGGVAEEIESAVNRWLADYKNVHLVKILQSGSGDNLTITIFYEEAVA